MFRLFLFMSIFLFVVIVSVVMFSQRDTTKIDLFKAVENSIPYTLEYKFDKGFQIINKKDGTIVQSNDKDVYQTMAKLQKEWVDTHIVIEHDKIRLLNDNNTTKEEFFVKSGEEMIKIKEFFKLK